MEIKYHFTADEIAAFEQDTLNDIFEEMDKGGNHIDDLDIFITIGNRGIRLPICADAHSGIIELLQQIEEDNR